MVAVGGVVARAGVTGVACVAGLCRGIDMEKRLYHILTPVPPEELRTVNCLLVGAVSLPQCVFTSQVSREPSSPLLVVAVGTWLSEAWSGPGEVLPDGWCGASVGEASHWCRVWDAPQAGSWGPMVLCVSVPARVQGDSSLRHNRLQFKPSWSVRENRGKRQR